MTGKVVRFDDVRGFGFIAPDGGGDDVFVHANDLCGEKSLFRSGVPVSFRVETGDRGRKAAEVQLVSITAASPANPVDEELCDVLTVDEFKVEVTEMLLSAYPALSGTELLTIRGAMHEVAAKHGWIAV